ncbi:MAG TPA: DoxX family protein [Verrucomicrobiae bacterium]|jgi:putative oxidoreductase|nr:DoxX family protein [Verrucomicrobiae bacterium]
MKKIFAPGNDSTMTSLGLLALRLWLGLTMLLHHGVEKINNFSQMAPMFFDPFHIGHQASLGLVVFAEAAGALLLAMGLLTRFAALTLVIDMAVAFFMVHKSLRGGELAFIYLAGFVALLLAGGGKCSLDHLIFGKGSGQSKRN